jgi:hypothetical protein
MTLCICSAKGSSMTAAAQGEILPCNKIGCQARFAMQDISLPTPETFLFLLSQAPVAFYTSCPIPGSPVWAEDGPAPHHEGDGGVGARADQESSPQYYKRVGCTLGERRAGQPCGVLDIEWFCCSTEVSRRSWTLAILGASPGLVRAP